MKRIYILLLALLPLFVLTSCKMEDSEERNSLKLALLIYNRSNRDMEFAASCLMNAVNFNKVLSAEDESKRAEYLDILFPSAEFTEHNGVYTLKFTTEYGSYYSLKFSTGGVALGDGEWRVEYSSGDNYELTLSPKSGKYINAELMFNNRDSEGVASLKFEYGYVDSAYNPDIRVGEIVIYGELTALDKQASEAQPVTIRTGIVSPLSYDHNMQFFTLGKVNIICHDALYNATDEVDAEYYVNPRRAVIECNGDSWIVV